MMSGKTMTRRLILLFLLILITSLSIITWFSLSSMRSFYMRETEQSLHAKALLLQPQVTAFFESDSTDFDVLNSLVHILGKSSETRITVIALDGTVLADSDEDYRAMDDHAARLEINEALSGVTGKSVRHSNTLQRTMMYLAIPLEVDEEIKGVLRVAVSTASIDGALNDLTLQNLLVVILVGIFGGILVVFFSRRAARPLVDLRKGAERFARGEFDERLRVPESEEIGQLARAMNSMAAEIDLRIKTITHQGNERQAILQSMVEGVVAVDTSEKIINMNLAAANLFQCEADEAEGKSAHEVLRNSALQQMLDDTLSRRESIEQEITIYNPGERFIHATSALIKDVSGGILGVLLVLNDLTKLKHLENVRRDFVANVSHELRTPITSIKGFVETLIDGAIDDKEAGMKFLKIIAVQADRLNGIIGDLLSLSSLDQDSQRSDISFNEANVRDLIDDVFDICSHKANAKKIEMVVGSPDTVMARINAPLIEQALINLIDNAIKYSPDGGQVMVLVSTDLIEARISISDNGPGIEKKHHARLFERFYRVDKARSRELGGTGLGLAICKHIALLHKGSVEVESEMHKGSTFTLSFPLK